GGVGRLQGSSQFGSLVRHFGFRFRHYPRLLSCFCSTLPRSRRNTKPLCRLDVSATSAANVPMNQAEFQTIVDWIIDGARSAAGPTELMTQACERSVKAGLPLWRVAVFV